MQTIKELKQLKDIRVNAVNQLWSMLPNYEVAKRFADDLDCDIETALLVANNLVPKIELYFKSDQHYYHIYNFSMITYDYAIKTLYPRECEGEKGEVIIKWHKTIDRISPYAIDMDSEIITKEEFEAKEALTK